MAQVLINKGCCVTERSARGQTGWDIAVAKGNIATFDTLAAISQSRVVTMDGAPGDLRFAELAAEYKLQRFRRGDCIRNQDPWHRLSAHIYEHRLAASLPTWKCVLTSQ